MDCSGFLGFSTCSVEGNGIVQVIRCFLCWLLGVVYDRRCRCLYPAILLFSQSLLVMQVEREVCCLHVVDVPGRDSDVLDSCISLERLRTAFAFNAVGDKSVLDDRC